ncbi:MAG: T9SS type A sorting domain-containing protein [Bacteroidales bacterium]|nr:T9SS type A sorting domain-containing protein [Bacteroidales bacterium]
MKKTTLILALFLGLVPMINAQWTSPGNGTTYTLPDLVAASNGVVTNDGNVFAIHSDLTISQNDVLQIDDQVSRIDAGNVLITIQGSMVCTNTQRVKFYGTTTEHFSLRFENATDCELKTMYFSDGAGIKLIESEVDFIDCKFVYFTRDYCNAVIDIFNSHPEIIDCYFLMNEGAAISSPANGQSSPKIINCQLDANVDGINSPQINLGPGGNDTIFILNNTIDDQYASYHVGGISVADLMGTGETKVKVSGNYVSDGRYGYNQQGMNITSVIEWNQFINNNNETNPMNGGSGISIYGMDENNKAIIRNNVITGNLWGITAINGFDIDLGTEDDWGNNEIHDNGNGGVIYDLYNNSAYDIMAVGNNWGTSSEQEVEEHIFHQKDNPELGWVTFIPFIGYDAVGENNTHIFEVWPNPTQGHFTVDGSGVMTITNTLGQTVLTREIDGKKNFELPQGLYVVKMGNATQKVIVE